MARRDETATGITQRDRPRTDVLVSRDGAMVDPSGNPAGLTAAQMAATQALVSGDEKTVAVYGATPAGVIAAVAAARLGYRVLLLSESDRLGGMMGWGINHQDINVNVTPGTIVGLAKRVLSDIGRRETNVAKNWQRFYRLSCDGRPSWFTTSIERLVAAEANITVARNVDLRSVTKSGTRITGIDLAGYSTVVAGAYIDASYTGDLAAAAGCTVAIGREANATYGETLNGARTPAAMTGSPSAYVTAGVPASGLLPFVDGSAIQTAGTVSPYVMCMNYRLFVTTNSSDRVAFPAPDMSRYNPLNYEILARQMNASSASFDTMAEVFNMYSAGLNAAYYDLNSRAGISTNYPNHLETLEYITASKARRAEIAENVKQWVLGLLYWIRYSGDARIPAGLVSDIANYGLSATELQATGGFSPELYVREGRRIVGDSVFTENSIAYPNTGVTNPIAFAYYDLDSHMVRMVNDAGTVKTEGTILQALTVNQIGAPLPYSVLLPKAAEVTNLLCPGSPSVSRVAWCTTRLEPMLMALGEASGIAAALSIKGGTTVQAVDQARLSRIMDPMEVWDGIVLDVSGTYAEGTISGSGTWAAPTSTSRRFGGLANTSLSNAGSSSGAATRRFAPYIQETAPYEVFVRYSPTSGSDSILRSTAVPVTVSHADGTATRTLNQRYGVGQTGKGGAWESLGIFTFRAENPAGTVVGAGTASVDYVEFANTGTGTDTVDISAVKWVRR